MTSYLIVVSNKSAAKCKKEEGRLKMEQLAEKRKKEVEDKAKAKCTAKK